MCGVEGGGWWEFVDSGVEFGVIDVIDIQRPSHQGLIKSEGEERTGQVL